MKYKFCVSGSADGSIATNEIKENIVRLGEEIIKQDGILVTGATSGAPNWVLEGAKKQKGFSIGLSPASSELEHIKKYRQPIDDYDVMIYTGFGYSGRNLILTRSADAVIVVSGRMGTLNEFTIAFEDDKPIGVLLESGGTADMIENIVKNSHRGLGKIVYESDPKKLVEKLKKLIKKEKATAKELEEFKVNPKLNMTKEQIKKLKKKKS